MEPGLADLKTSVVRILAENGMPVGAGFLITEYGHVLTCAHVVVAALSISADTTEKPVHTIHLDFPFLGAVARAARVECWQPLRGPSTNPSGDVAALKLVAAPPDGARPARLTTVANLYGRGFSAYGFPEGYDAGVWAYGLLRDNLGNGWLQVEDTKGPGGRIEPGFSGGPVEDRETGRIVGMVAAAARDKSEKVGFVIPAGVLAQACPNLISPAEIHREAAVEINTPKPRDIFMPRPAIASSTDRIQCLLTSSGNSEIQSVGFSSTTKLLVASGGADKTVRLWRLESETLIREMEHELGLRSVMSSVGGKTNSIASRDVVSRVAFSPDGALVASGGADKTARLWRVEGGALVGELKHKGPLAYVNSLAFSPDGRLLATGLQNGTVYLWRVQDGALLRHMKHGRLMTHVCSLAFFPDGRFLASGANDGTVWLWRWGDGRTIHKMRHGGWSTLVQSVAFSSDGQILASGGTDGRVRLWMNNGVPLYTLEGHKDWVTSVAISQDRRILASASRDTTVWLWRIDDGIPLYTLTGHARWVNSVAISRDRRLVASGSNDGTVKLWGAARPGVSFPITDKSSFG